MMDISDWPRQIRDRYVHAPNGVPTDDVSKVAEEIAWFIEQAVTQHGGKMDQNIDISQNPEKLRALVLERGARIERLERALQRIIERYEGSGVGVANIAREALADDGSGSGMKIDPKTEAAGREAYPQAYENDPAPPGNDALNESNVTVTRALTYLGYLLNSALCGGYEPHRNLYQYHQAVRSILVKLQEDEYYDTPNRDALEAWKAVSRLVNDPRKTKITPKEWTGYRSLLGTIHQQLTAPPTVPEAVRRLPDELRQVAARFKQTNYERGLYYAIAALDRAMIAAAPDPNGKREGPDQPPQPDNPWA